MANLAAECEFWKACNYRPLARRVYTGEECQVAEAAAEVATPADKGITHDWEGFAVQLVAQQLTLGRRWIFVDWAPFLFHYE